MRSVRVIVAGLALSAALAASASAPHRAEAAQTNCGAYGDVFSGYATNSSLPYIGARITLTPRSSTQCTNLGGGLDDRRSHAWVMMVQTPGGTGGWSQIGTNRKYGGVTKIWSQYTTCATGPGCGVVDNYSSVTSVDNVVRTFEVKYVGSCGCFYNSWAGNLLSWTSWDPWANGWTTAGEQYMTEKSYQGSDIPGLSSSTTDFVNLQSQDIFSGDWVTNGNSYRSATSASRSVLTGFAYNSFGTWTYPLT